MIDKNTGQAISGLSVQNFTAALKHSAVRITALEPIRTRRLLVLVDWSGSVTDPYDDVNSHTKKATETALQAINAMLGELPNGLAVQYGIFSDVTVFGDDFISDSAALRKSFQSLKGRFPRKGHRKTSLYDSLGDAVRRFENPQAEDAILVLTDGGENSSKHGLKALEQELLASRIRLFIMLLNDHLFLPEERLQREGFIAASRQSGGNTYLLDVTKPGWGFDKQVRAAAQDLRRFCDEEVLNGYLLQIEVPADSSKERPWHLSTTNHPGVVLRYPDRLAACSAQRP